MFNSNTTATSSAVINDNTFNQISKLMPNDLIRFPLNGENDGNQFFDQHENPQDTLQLTVKTIRFLRI